MNVQVISFHCLLKNKAGKLISTTYNRDVINSFEGPDSALKGLVYGLQNLKAGEKRTIHLTAEEAYGLYDPKKVIFFPLKKLSKDALLKSGEKISIASKSGQIRTYRVAQVHGDMVSLDGNHPLAGQDLVFEIEATHVREARADEISDNNNQISTQYLH